MKNNTSASCLHRIVCPKHSKTAILSAINERDLPRVGTCTPQEKWFIYLRLINLDQSNMCMFILKYSCIVI